MRYHSRASPVKERLLELLDDAFPKPIRYVFLVFALVISLLAALN